MAFGSVRTYLVLDSPITNSPVAGKYWGIDATIQYGGSSNGSASLALTNTTAGIVDSGTGLLYLPEGTLLRESRLLPDMRTQTLITPYYCTLGAYSKYANAIGAVFDPTTKLLRITEAQYNNLQSLNFVIGGKTFELTPNAQIIPRPLRGGDKGLVYLVVQNLGNNFPGVDFICGVVFLERFYTVLDSGNRRVGLASTPFTNATTN